MNIMEKSGLFTLCTVIRMYRSRCIVCWGKNLNITLLPPLDYLPLVHLLRNSTLVMTDSGGIQEEAPGFGIPTLVLREVTERPEGVEAGVSQVGGHVY